MAGLPVVAWSAAAPNGSNRHVGTGHARGLAAHVQRAATAAGGEGEEGAAAAGDVLASWPLPGSIAARTVMVDAASIVFAERGENYCAVRPADGRRRRGASGSEKRPRRRRSRRWRGTSRRPGARTRRCGPVVLE